MWIDTHCHPFAKPYNKDRELVFQRARDAGVNKMICVGFNEWANKASLQLAAENEDIWATLGVHPCDCEELTNEYYKWMRDEAERNGRVVAIGETGLDYHHMIHGKDVQEDAFRKHIRLASELDLPLVVHSRDAANDTLRILLDEGAKKVIFHCYSYGYEFGKKLWEAGYYTSFSGVLTYPAAKDVQEAAKKGPLELMLIETDCPYLAPQSIRGKRNEMVGVVEVGKKLAELRGVSDKEIATETTGNAEILFGI